MEAFLELTSGEMEIYLKYNKHDVLSTKTRELAMENSWPENNDDLYPCRKSRCNGREKSVGLRF